jgi:hypothetical protein
MGLLSIRAIIFTGLIGFAISGHRSAGSVSCPMP